MSRVVDISGRRYGRLVVLERAGNYLGKARWRCICDCGSETFATTSQLRSGQKKSCGCLRFKRRRGADLVGQRFGRLTAIRDNGRRHGLVVWLCRCSCGELTNVVSTALRNGNTKSCGCLHRERAAALNKTHGLAGASGSHPRLYRIWRGMRQRCAHPSQISYQYYGARGISVCKEWQDDYLPFHEWAMSNGYDDDLTLDRIDVDGDYCPENCRWTTWDVQNNNRRAS